MLTVRHSLYMSRFRKHVSDTRKHLQEPDYVQASEKVWGAMSSFVNAMSIVEVTGVRDKKEKFSDLYTQLSVKHTDLKQALKNAHCDNAFQFATKAEGLHLYFFGARDYPEHFIKSTLEESVKLLEEVEKVFPK